MHLIHGRISIWHHYYCYHYFILFSLSHVIEQLKTVAFQISEVSPRRRLGFRLVEIVQVNLFLLLTATKIR